MNVKKCAAAMISNAKSSRFGVVNAKFVLAYAVGNSNFLGGLGLHSQMIVVFYRCDLLLKY
jgi:hypothetical protein